MRHLLAAACTTALPMFVGARWVHSASAVVRWSLGAVVGIALLGIGAYLGGFLGSPIVGAAALLILGWLASSRLRWGEDGLEPVALAKRLMVVLVVVGLTLMVMSLFRPVASWDGWFIWSLKSKGLDLTGSFDSPVFVSGTYFWSSQEYPPFLPAWQALAYLVSGDLTVSWPLQFQQAWLWTAGAMALVGLIARSGRGSLLLPFVWVVTPQVVWQSMQGYADVPMALLLVIGTVVLWRAPHDPRAHVLGGLLLGAAALMKAEGLPLALIAAGSLLVSRRPRWFFPLAPAIVLVAWTPWLLFAQSHDLSSHLLEGSTIAAVLRGDVSPRLVEITTGIVAEMFSPLRWGILVPACILTVAVVRRIHVRLAIATALQLALFASIYVLSWSAVGLTLEDYMGSNVDRILIAPLGFLSLAVALRARTGAAGLAEIEIPEPQALAPSPR